MKILLALPHDTLSGAEQYLKMLASHYLKQVDCQVFVVFLKRKTELGWEDLQGYPNVKLIYTTQASEMKGLPAFMWNIVLLRKYKFDYIYTSHVSLTGIIGLFIRLRVLNKGNFVGRESTTIFQRFKGIKLLSYKVQYFMGYPSLDLLICQTDLMRNQLVNALPRLSKRIRIAVMPNPVDLTAMRQLNRELPAEDLNQYGRFVVSAGRLIPEKGFDLLMMAFAKIYKQDKSLKLIILGEGKDRHALENLIKDLHLEGVIFLPGFTQDVYSYFKAATLAVVSSRIEGFPNVLLQMMSQNHKIVATSCAGGIDEIEGLFIARPKSISSLQQAMQNALITPTAHNRTIFDNYLNKRSIDKFVASVDDCL